MSQEAEMATKLSKDRLQWAINETNSMRQAALLLGIAYNTFKSTPNNTDYGHLTLVDLYLNQECQEDSSLRS